MKAPLLFKKLFEENSVDNLHWMFEFLAMPLPKNTSKSSMIDVLASGIITHPVHYLKRFPEYEVRLLRDLSMLGPGGRINVLRKYFYPFLTAFHLVQLDEVDDSILEAYITPDIYRYIGNASRKAWASGELGGEHRYEYFVWGCMCLYGFLNIDELEKIVRTHFPKEADNAIKYLAQNPLISTMRPDNDNVCHPDAFELFEDLMGERAEAGYMTADPHDFKTEFIMEIGRTMPITVPYRFSVAGIKLLETFRSLDFTDEDSLYIMHDIWVSMQTIGEEEVRDLIEEYLADDENFKDTVEEDMNVLAEAVVRYCDVIPLWKLKGRSLKDIGKNLDPKKFSTDYITLGHPHPSLGHSKRVSPDDPCPCGSGLKYKNCHGKNLN